jgi:hypothetical protein
MFIGPTLFFLNESGKLEMQLTPALPSWLFEDEASDNDPSFDSDGNHIVEFTLLGSIPVTYHNPGGKNRYGEHPTSYSITKTNGQEIAINGPTVPTETALLIRRMTEVASIDAYFA